MGSIGISDTTLADSPCHPGIESDPDAATLHRFGQWPEIAVARK
jgi:hypothetical protein